MVLRIAYTYLKNRADAEDIVQDVFLRIIDKKPSFNDENHEKSWLIRATINMCKNKVNMFWNKNKCSIDDVQEFAVSDKYNTDTSVFQAVMALGEKYRVVVYMYYYEGYSTPEIANVIGKSETTIRSLLHRARNKLKDMLKEDYDFE
ncbi:MAG: sigma-70 family RNA polymerase sigma factor [Clostridiales bacterium]|nr:sigma-70 family RNA polymerase sigma factor [Clostridiales bacterium]